jgi:hypothetical protein
MFQRISNSFRLVKESWAVLRQDKEIMLFPVVSGITSLVIAASFIVPLVLVVAADGPKDTDLSPFWYPLMFLFYLLTYFVTIFFNVGVMHCAAIRMDGGNPTVADGFRGAFSHIGSIFLWSLISATVGIVLRIIEREGKILGKIVAAIIGTAWTLITYFVVPLIIFEKAGVGQAIKRSAGLFKKTWGETVVGEAGIGLVFGLLSLLGFVPIALAIFLGSAGFPLVLCMMLGAIAIAYWILLAVVSAALTGIFNVALYRFAATGNVPSSFTPDLVSHHWRPKG